MTPKNLESISGNGIEVMDCDKAKSNG